MTITLDGTLGITSPGLLGDVLATQAEAQAGTNNTKVMTPLRVAEVAGPRLGTSQVSTSGTQIDFTGIPSWVKRVTVMLDGVSTSGTNGFSVQLGDSGGIEGTGYISTVLGSNGTTVAHGSSTVGFGPVTLIAAGDALRGAIQIANFSGNTWVATGFISRNTTSTVALAGTKTLSALLTQLRIVALSTDTFDAGSINISWE
jgi:hypothetical protein